MLGGLAAFRQLFGGTSVASGPYYPKIFGLVTDLSFGNFNASGLKTLLWKQVVADGNSGAAFALSWLLGAQHTLTLTAACTLTMTAPSGVSSLRLNLVQDGTGSRTVTWPASVKWAGGVAPTLTTAAGAVDIVTFFYDGTNYYGVAGLHFA